MDTERSLEETTMVSEHYSVEQESTDNQSIMELVEAMVYAADQLLTTAQVLVTISGEELPQESLLSRLVTAMESAEHNHVYRDLLNRPIPQQQPICPSPLFPAPVSPQSKPWKTHTRRYWSARDSKQQLFSEKLVEAFAQHISKKRASLEVRSSSL